MSERMFKTGIRTLVVALACTASELTAAGGVVVIAHASLTRLDPATLEKIYTGKVIEVDGIPITAVNASRDSDIRNRFLQTYLNKDEERYTKYWNIRRYSGFGAPPPELPSSTDIINFVKITRGGIGYIDEADVPPGVNVLLK